MRIDVRVYSGRDPLGVRHELMKGIAELKLPGAQIQAKGPEAVCWPR